MIPQVIGTPITFTLLLQLGIAAIVRTSLHLVWFWSREAVRNNGDDLFLLCIEGQSVVGLCGNALWRRRGSHLHGCYFPGRSPTTGRGDLLSLLEYLLRLRLNALIQSIPNVFNGLWNDTDESISFWGNGIGVTNGLKSNKRNAAWVMVLFCISFP